MKNWIIFFVAGLFFTFSITAREIHVSVNGNDQNEGSSSKPLKTISGAARVAQPGDVITVHAGTYREQVNPPRGGTSEDQRIVFRAADNEHVVIKGSEVVKGWKKMENGAWKVSLPNAFFGDHNPYKTLIEGDWFNDNGRSHHTGEVFLNNKALYEMDGLEKVLRPEPLPECQDPEGSTYTWYCESDENQTSIYANFHDYNPNRELVEISVRKTCFYPERRGVNFITIRGFHMSQAATQWAAPTAEQIGLIATHWSKGWIIEDNIISNSRCSGITLGKDRKTGHNVWSNNPAKDGATHYNEVILRALDDGWSKEQIGHHIVRNNTISHCEQTGICGSLGAVFSEITDNHIYDIWTKRQFSGAEIAGIKIHASIDMLIKNNWINNAGRALWMDWMAQGTRLSGNLCYDNTTDDLFVEVNHGPFLIDNNIFLSELAIRDWSEGGAYVHNLIAGALEVRAVLNRTTPYHHPHATAMKGYKHIVGGDNRFYNNIFTRGIRQSPKGVNAAPRASSSYGLNAYDAVAATMYVHGNVYLNGAEPFDQEGSALILPDADPAIGIVEREGSVQLSLTLDPTIGKQHYTMVTSALLGKTIISEQGYELPNGSALEIKSDYFDRSRRPESPYPGPFGHPDREQMVLEVW